MLVRNVTFLCHHEEESNSPHLWIQAEGGRMGVTLLTNRICWKWHCASSGHSWPDSFCSLPTGSQQPCKRYDHLRRPRCEKPKPCRETPESEIPWRKRKRNWERPRLGNEKTAWKWTTHPSCTSQGHVIRDTHTHPPRQATKFLTLNLISKIKWWLQVTKFQGSLLKRNSSKGSPQQCLWMFKSQVIFPRSAPEFWQPGHDPKGKTQADLLWEFWPALGERPKATRLSAPHSSPTEKFPFIRTLPIGSLQPPFTPLP